MAESVNDLGGLNDRVTLVLNGESVLVAEAYEVKQSFLTQPSAFSITLGHGGVAKDIIRRYPPKTPFELRIGDIVQMVGETDGYIVSGNAEATTVSIRGRDALAPLHDACVESDTSFTETSFKDLVTKVLSKVPIIGYSIFFNNDENRKRGAGVPVKTTGEPDYLAEVLSSLPAKKNVQAKAGERWYGYLKKELDQAGLFLFAGVDGTFILTAPNGQQKPTYRVVRQRGALRNAVNVTDFHFKNETTHRYAEYVVLGRAGRPTTSVAPDQEAPENLEDVLVALKNSARGQLDGRFLDQEMVDLGYTRKLVKKNKKASNAKRADFYARRLAGEHMRAGFELTYQVSGQTVPSLFGGRRAVWSVDTIVEVIDDELGISGSFWIESVTRKKSMGSGTTSELTLMDPRHLVFGGDA